MGPLTIEPVTIPPEWLDTHDSPVTLEAAATWMQPLTQPDMSYSFHASLPQLEENHLALLSQHRIRPTPATHTVGVHPAPLRMPPDIAEEEDDLDDEVVHQQLASAIAPVAIPSASHKRKASSLSSSSSSSSSPESSSTPPLTQITPPNPKRRRTHSLDESQVQSPIPHSPVIRDSQHIPDFVPPSQAVSRPVAPAAAAAGAAMELSDDTTALAHASVAAPKPRVSLAELLQQMQQPRTADHPALRTVEDVSLIDIDRLSAFHLQYIAPYGDPRDPSNIGTLVSILRPSVAAAVAETTDGIAHNPSFRRDSSTQSRNRSTLDSPPFPLAQSSPKIPLFRPGFASMRALQEIPYTILWRQDIRCRDFMHHADAAWALTGDTVRGRSTAFSNMWAHLFSSDHQNRCLREHPDGIKCIAPQTSLLQSAIDTTPIAQAPFSISATTIDSTTTTNNSRPASSAPFVSLLPHSMNHLHLPLIDQSCDEMAEKNHGRHFTLAFARHGIYARGRLGVLNQFDLPEWTVLQQEAHNANAQPDYEPLMWSQPRIVDSEIVIQERESHVDVVCHLFPVLARSFDKKNLSQWTRPDPRCTKYAWVFDQLQCNQLGHDLTIFLKRLRRRSDVGAYDENAIPYVVSSSRYNNKPVHVYFLVKQWYTARSHLRTAFAGNLQRFSNDECLPYVYLHRPDAPMCSGPIDGLMFNISPRDSVTTTSTSSAAASSNTGIHRRSEVPPMIQMQRSLIEFGETHSAEQASQLLVQHHFTEEDPYEDLRAPALKYKFANTIDLLCLKVSGSPQLKDELRYHVYGASGDRLVYIGAAVAGNEQVAEELYERFVVQRQPALLECTLHRGLRAYSIRTDKSYPNPLHVVMNAMTASTRVDTPLFSILEN